MIQLDRPWQHAGEGNALHFMVKANGKQRHVKLKRAENAALYDFLLEHGGISPKQPPATPAGSDPSN